MELPIAQVWSICDRSQTALRPWRDAGYSVCSIDIVEASGDMPHVNRSIHDVESLPGAQFILAWPPCTHLAASGARWWRDKGPEALAEALANVNACKRLIGSTPGIIENPKGRLSSNWRPPDCYVHPWEFSGYASGESYTKETGLWLLNGAKRPLTSYSAEPIDTKRIHHMDSFKRSNGDGIKTPLGMSIGIFLANKHLVTIP